ncbi:MAG: ethanolamine ammonia-lyase subunit EutC [Desulfacinum sp.]|nr:ethanolamine ammonia-lyase subunit EutC [Desulfacinum sp.]
MLTDHSIVMHDFDFVLEQMSPNRPVFRNPSAIGALKSFTPARIALGGCGCRPFTRDVLRFRADHAAARDSVMEAVRDDFLARHGLVKVCTQAADKEEYLMRPDKGRRLDEAAVERLGALYGRKEPMLVLVGDGLSATAVEANLDALLPSLRLSLDQLGHHVPPPVFVQFARVGAMDHVGDILEPEVVIFLIGERPGLQTAESLSAYICFRPRTGTLDADRTVVSNIHRRGLPPLEAGAVVAETADRILRLQASGVRLGKICGQ